MGVCVCGFCNVWVCVCVGFVMCGCVYVCVCVGFVMSGRFVNTYFFIVCTVFVLFRLCIFILICLCWCKDCCTE
jgi:hypothetical protein